MFNRVKKNPVLTNAGIYVISTVINQALPFLLLPLLTRYLNPREYGYVALYQLYFAFSNILCGSQTTFNISKNFYTHDKESMARLISNLTIISLIATSLILLLIHLVLLTFGNIFSFPEKWIYILPAVSFFSNIGLFNVVVLRNRQRAMDFGKFQLILTTMNVGLSIFLIVIFKQGWEGRVRGISIAYIIYGIVGLYYLIRTGYFQIDINRNTIRDIVEVTSFLVPSAFLFKIIDHSWKIFINNRFGKYEVGIYNISFSMGMIVFFLSLSVFQSLEPWLYEKLSQTSRDIEKSIMRVILLYFTGLLLLAGLISIFSGFIIRLMTTPEYYSASHYVIWISFGFAFWGIYSIFVPFIIKRDKQKVLLLITLIGAIVNLSSNYILIQSHGLAGAGQSFLLTYLVMFILISIYVSKLYDLHWVGMIKQGIKKA